jgi:hypothetical protein
MILVEEDLNRLSQAYLGLIGREHSFPVIYIYSERLNKDISVISIKNEISGICLKSC